jgi:putative phosphoribosyl transferase
MRFIDRADAGRRLAERLQSQVDEHVVVLGLPRGGVPVAAEVARALGAPLDVIVVRKLGVPFQPELAMGAIGEGGAKVVNDEIVRDAAITPSELAEVETAERLELERQAGRFRGDRRRVDLSGRVVVIVDDARALGATRVVLAVPVAPIGAREGLADDVDDLVVLSTPEPFHAVGGFYDDFSQVGDEEVIDLLDRSARGTSSGAPGASPPDVRLQYPEPFSPT